MTRKHFVMLSNALHDAMKAARVRIANSDSAYLEEGVRIAAQNIATVLKEEVGPKFDIERFMKDVERN